MLRRLASPSPLLTRGLVSHGRPARVPSLSRLASSKTGPPSRKLVTAAKFVSGTTALCAGGLLTYAYLFDEGAWRTVRVLRSLLPMGIDYWGLWYRTRAVSEEQKRVEFDAYHDKWRDEPLRVCLDLRGFYVKVGQLCAGFPGDGLPLPYKESLKVLQEHVPPQPFERIRAIAEGEIGCKLEDVFAEFDAEPIGAASIGQVHRARLLDGTEVVVKVQYPECESNFRMDFTTIVSICAPGPVLPRAGRPAVASRVSAVAARQRL